VGLSALINGSTDIANSSRPIKQTEMDKLKARYNTLALKFHVQKTELQFIYIVQILFQNFDKTTLSDISGKSRIGKKLADLMQKLNYTEGKTVQAHMFSSKIML